MKYVSQDNLKQYDTRIKKYISDKLMDEQTQIDMYSYGIQWKINSNKPVRIGNSLLHKSLPIQSSLKGCIAQGNKIQYYLNPTDWSGDVQEGNTRINKTDSSASVLTLTSCSIPLAKNNIVRLSGYLETLETKARVISVNSNTIQLQKISTTGENENWENYNTYNTSCNIILLPQLDGTDGQVMVEVPEFYLWSTTNNDVNEVRISTKQLVPYALKIPRMLVSAYTVTILRNTVTGKGWLDTLSAQTCISVVNNENYCRGGNNETTYDGSKFSSTLQKPATNYSRSDCEAYAKKIGCHCLNYEYYKAIFYWLPVIEFCNFETTAAFNANLTSDGYHQGGLGLGCCLNANYGPWETFNGTHAIIPLGYTNRFGNSSGEIKNIATGLVTAQCNRYRGLEQPFGDVLCNVHGFLMTFNSNNNVCAFYTTTNPDNYTDSDLSKLEFKGNTYCIDTTYAKEFSLGNQANFFPLNTASRETSKYVYVNVFGSLIGLLLGGCVGDASDTGLGRFLASTVPYGMSNKVAFRTYCLLD